MRTTSKRHCLRTGRYSETGRIYLVTIVVDNRQRLFHDWSSGRPVVQALQAAEEDGLARSLCWVLMPDHLHWLLELQTGELSATVARFKSRSTVWANRQWQRTGRLWQKGYHDHALRKDEDLQACARYVVMNPVRAGLISSVRHYSLWDAIWL